MKRTLYVIAILLILVTGCNMPQADDGNATEGDGVAFTQAAQTVQAEMTRLAPTQAPTAFPTVAIPTSSIPTNTQVPPATATPIPCNLAGFESDVTIPDGTIVTPGQLFTKTWRLRNVGSCTWTSGYQLVFHQGDAMGVPSGYAQALTAGTVPPGGTVDISVNLTAPLTAGTFKGYWRLRDPGGQFFALRNGNDFWVQVQVSSAATTSTTLVAVSGESGTIRGDGHISTAELIVGDASNNNGVQIFLSFNISGIPTNATITEAKIDFTAFTGYGDPFDHLGCLDVYESNYGVMDAADFFAGVPSGPYFEWCNSTALSNVVADGDFRSLNQSRLGNSRIQARMQFPTTITNGDSSPDIVSFTAP
jgi:hypothetical protein